MPILTCFELMNWLTFSNTGLSTQSDVYVAYSANSLSLFTIYTYSLYFLDGDA